jgi:predicted secreted protein
VTLKSGTIPPTGTVTFKKGAKVLGTASVGANGVAVVTISTLKAGTNSITADYAGDASDNASKSSAVTVTIT